MTDDDLRDSIARAIDPVVWMYYASGMFPPDHPAAQAVVKKSREAADRVIHILRANGMWPEDDDDSNGR